MSVCWLQVAFLAFVFAASVAASTYVLTGSLVIAVMCGVLVATLLLFGARQLLKKNSAANSRRK